MKRSDTLIYKICGLFFIPLLSSCTIHKIVEHAHYTYNNHVFDLYDDGSYQYLLRMEGGYVYKYGAGSWYQNGKNVILSSDTYNLLNVNKGHRNFRDQGMIMNIKIDSNYNYSYHSDVFKQMSVEVVIDGKAFTLDEKTTVIDSVIKINKLYFKAYPKLSEERYYEILNDTLYSRVFKYPFEETGVVTFDVKCDPIQFSQINMSSDTLKIINKNKVKWGKINLRR